MIIRSAIEKLDGQETIPLTIEKCIISNITKMNGLMSVVMQKILDISLSSRMNLALLLTLKDLHNRHIFLI
jgi:hypothetical protein